MITSYSTLQSKIATMLNRDDLTSEIPTFIQMAEVKMWREINHWRMEKRATATFDEQYEELPPDWRAMIRVALVNDRPLTLISQDDMTERRQQDSTAGKPWFYAMSAAQIELYPTPDGSYSGEMIYKATPPSLSSEVASNWILEIAPDVYFYGALIHTAPFLVEDERLATWGALYRAAVETLNTDGMAQYSGTGLKKRLR